MVIKAIIFDCDGTLVDTEQCAYEAFQDLYAEYGQDLPLDLWQLCVGTWGGPFDPYNHLNELTGQELDRVDLKARFEIAHHAKIQCLKLNSGVTEALQAARQLGLRIGLASSSDRKWIEGHLEAQGIREYFEAILSADDVVTVKPDPALYRLAVEALGVRPEEAVAIEDSRHGMMSAINAGLRTIIVPNEVTSSMDFKEADLVIPSLDAQPLEQLLEQLTAMN